MSSPDSRPSRYPCRARQPCRCELRGRPLCGAGSAESCAPPRRARRGRRSLCAALVVQNQALHRDELGGGVALHPISVILHVRVFLAGAAEGGVRPRRDWRKPFSACLRASGSLSPSRSMSFWCGSGGWAGAAAKQRAARKARQGERNGQRTHRRPLVGDFQGQARIVARSARACQSPSSGGVQLRSCTRLAGIR